MPPDSNQREVLETSINTLAQQVAASLGMEVVRAEIKGGGGRSVVRIFLDQPGGISLNDCERFSRQLSVLLDVEDWIPFSYTLEVSSPGLDRPLVKEADFRRFAGKKAKVRTRTPIEGENVFRGVILDAAEGRLDLEVEPGRRIEIPLAEIERANLIIDI
jgi:ribosome maturation factor RimP